MRVHGAVRVALVRALLAAVLLTLLPERSTADWVQTSGPRGGAISSLLTVSDGAGGTNLFAGQIYVWRSGDHGASWTRLTNGLTQPAAFDLLAVPSGSGGHNILVGTGGGVFRSADQGGSWSSSNIGIANLSIYSLESGPNGSGGTNLYAGAGGLVGKVFRSTDNGATWSEASSGLPVGQTNVEDLITAPSGAVLAATGNGIYRSTDFGASWTRVFTLFGLSLARHGSTLYAGTSNGVYRSTNDGASWMPINSGMTFNWVYALAAVPNGSGVVLFANQMRSIDDGITWTSVANGLTSPSIQAFAFASNASGGTDVFAGTGRGVFRTSDFGNSWTDVSFIYSQVQAVESTPSGVLLAGTETVLHRSTDAGVTWIDPGSGTTALDFAVNLHSPSGTSIFAGNSPAGIYKSTNDGVTWDQSSNGLDDFDVNSMGAIPNGSGGTNLLAGTATELFISTNDGGFWQKANLQTLALDYTVTPNGSGGHDVWAAGYGGVWLSTNYGTAWTPRSSGIAGFIVQGIAATSSGANLFAGGDPFGIYRSTNSGATWSPANNGITDLRITTVFSPDGTNLFAAGAGGVYLSTDHGNSWTSVSTGLTTGVYQLAASADGTTLLAGTTGLGVWKRPLSEMISGGPPPPPPPPAPIIASFTPASGSAGTVVTILGNHFTGASAVTFNLVASSFTVVSATEVRATVPSGASTGRIRVTTTAGTGTGATDFSVTAPPPPATYTFTPPHDAWVRSSSPSSNFGSRPELSVRRNSPTMRSYLKFVVSGVTGTVQAARLRLRVTDAGPDGGFVYSVSNNFKNTSTPWTESGLTWNNAPTLGSNRGYAGTATANAWLEVDVTAAVSGNGTFSFAVSGGSNNQVDYSSSEGTFPPQLVVVSTGSVAPLTESPPQAGMAAVPPTELALHANYPNPFDVGTTIRYALPQTMPVRLVIYDITGRAVRTLVDGTEAAGERRATWDGRDATGSRVRAGIYLCRLEAAGARLTRKISVMR
jgi:hypothetical protein